ncbi:hypothetical protein Tco_1210863 [Tanacetum coccineum]
MAPRAVLMKIGLKSVNTARSFNTVRPSYIAHPKSIIHCARPMIYFQNQAQSTLYRPFYKRTTLTKRCFNQRFNDVTASACWVWKPKNRVIDHVSKNNIASVTLKRLDYIDSQGRFKQKDQEDEVFGSIKHPLSKDKEGQFKTIEERTTSLLIEIYSLLFKYTAVCEKVNAAESLLVCFQLKLNANCD